MSSRFRLASTACRDVEPRQAHLVRTGARAPAHLRREHDLVPPAAERLAEHRLGLAGRVDVRRVDEIDAGIERAADERVDALLVDAADHFPHLSAAAERHRAEAQLGDEHTGVGQFPIVH